MRTLTRRLLLGTAGTLALARPGHAATSSWDATAARGALRVGVIVARPPYFWKENGTWSGFSAQMGRDLATALGQAMGRPIAVEFVETTWATVILDIQADRIDAFFGLSRTPQRDQAIHLFGPLYALPEVLLTARDFKPADTSWHGLDRPDHTFSVVLGTTDEQTARQLLPHARIRAMKGMAEAVMDVQTGYGQALVTTVLVGLGAMKATPNFGAMLIPTPTLTSPSFGGTRRDGDGRLAAWMQNWGAEYRRSGQAKKVILAAMQAYGLDIAKLPPAVEF